MSQKLSEYVMLGALILVVVGFSLEAIELWPILQNHITTLFVHFGAVLTIVAIGVRAYRKEVVRRSEVVLLAAIILATWYTDLSLIGKLVVH